MAKGSNNVKPKRSHLYKPYDSANSSLVARFTSRVSEILPQPSSWLSRWLTPAEQDNFRTESEDDDDDGNNRQQPPPKRLCLRPPSTDVTTQQNHVRNMGTDIEISPILRSRSDQADGVVAGPSGLHLRGANFVASTPAVQVPIEPPVKVNGDEGSDGSESTSGCSSLVPQGERTLTAPFQENTPKVSPETPKLAITPSSLGGRRLSIKPKNRTMDLSSSLVKSRPSFDAYAFNNPLNKSSPFNTSLNRTLDDSSTSPFYRGRTMYGGNSSCKESLSLSLMSPKVGTPRIVSVKPTPTPVQNRDTISTSALKILRAIEQFSTPVLDTRKIPIRSESERRKRKAPQPFEELVMPTMPDLLRIKRRELAVSESTSAPPTPSTSSTASTPKPYQLPPPVQPLSVRDDVPELKRVMKGKNVEEMSAERVEKVNLPSIPLPISTLPTFNLSSLPTTPSAVTSVPPPTPTPNPNLTISKPSTVTPQPAAAPAYSLSAATTNQSSFKFSRPIFESEFAFSHPESIKLKLKFSEPLTGDAPSIASTVPITDKGSPNAKSPLLSKRKSSTIQQPAVNFQSNSSSTFQPLQKKPNNEKSTSSQRTYPDNNAGSIADFFSKEKKVNNNNDTKAPTKGFGEQFKPAAGSWTCDSCLVSNGAEKNKCSCCETPKPGTKDTTVKQTSTPAAAVSEKTWSCSKCSFKNKESVSTCVCGLKKGDVAPSLPPLSGSLKDFAKAPPDTWECKECFIRNKTNDIACAACSSPKPGSSVAKPPVPSLTSLFKKPEGSWECSTCMISNKSVDTACVACGTSNPGAVPAPKAASAFSFGIPPTTASTAPSTASTTSSSFAAAPATNKFTFGVPANGSEDKDNGLATSGQFKFGMPQSSPADKSKENTEEKVNAGANASTFVFGSTFAPSQKKSESTPVVVVDDDDHKEKPPKKRVSFGEPLERVEKPLENSVNTETQNKSSAPTLPFAGTATKTEPSTTTFQFPAPAAKPSPFGSTSGAASSSTDAKASKESTLKSGSNSTGVSSSTDPTTTVAPAPTSTATTVASGLNIFSSSSTSNKPLLFSMPENKQETSFGGGASSNPTFLSSSSADPKPVFNFGTVNKTEAADTSKVEAPKANLFTFKEKQQTLFGMPAPSETEAPGFFKVSENKTGFFNSDSNENKNIFGSAVSDKLNAPAFGANTNSVFELKPATPVNNSTSVFNAAPVAPASIFGSQTAMLNSSEQKPLAFGAMQSTPSSNATFVFKGADATPKPISGGFAFPAATPAQNPAPPANAFGFNAETPKFGVSQPNPVGFGTPSAAPFSASSATPLFSNPTPAAASSPFTFGASQPVEQQQPQPPPFGFQASQPQAVATPFTFNVHNTMSTPTPAQPPTFDPTIKPTFNFTGGATPSFAAPPSTSTETKQPDRKFRRAIRRTQPR